MAGEDGITSEPGIFAAGDIRTKNLRQVVTAVADGANAVASAQRYLLDKQFEQSDSKELQFLQFNGTVALFVLVEKSRIKNEQIANCTKRVE